ncbi:integrase-like protein [Caballeronia peredens]|nr:integrase-like protein [Caballeronia peredens]
MNARRRQAARRNWPANLYQNANGYLWFRNPTNGKTLGLGTDLQKAIRLVKLANMKMEQERAERDLLALTSEGSLTLAAHCDEYEKEYIVGKRSASSIKSQINAIRQDERATKPIDKFTPKDAADLIKEAAENRGPTMARGIRSRLKDIFRDAITHGLIERNPVESVLKPKVKIARMRMTEADFWKIFEQAEPQWLKNAMLLALVTGQRQADIIGMRFDNVKDGFLWIEQGKTGAKLKIPLDVSLGAYSIDGLVAQCRDRFVSRFLVHYSENRYSNKRGQPVSQISLQQAFQAAREKAELDMADGATPTTFHEIRSLAARMHTEARGSAFAQALLGHKSSAMTDLYRDVRGQQWIEVKTG